MSNVPERSRVKWVLVSVVFAILIAVIIVGIVVRSTALQDTSQDTPRFGSEPTVPASPAPSSTKEAEVGEVDGVPEFDPATTIPETSAEKQPSEEQVWAYEEAYNTPDPTKRAELLVPVANEQYLSESNTALPDQTNGLTVEIVQSESKIIQLDVSDDRFTCLLVTEVTVTTSRDGVHVATYTLPEHGSVWVNTVAGWRVTRDLGGG